MQDVQMTGNLLGNVAFHMRENLSEMALADGKLAPPEKRKRFPELDKNAAFACQGHTRLLRTALNLETIGALLRNPDFERESCDIVQLVSDFCEVASDLAEIAGIRLTFSCMESGHICAVHPEYMRQCMGHMVSNSMKNSPESGHIRVSLQFPRSEERFTLSVEDNGRGIAPEKMLTLFEEGWIRSPEELLSGGAGVGLSICKRIAEGHGGSLTAKSAPGKGSQFTLRVPDEKGMMKFRQPGFYEPNGGVNPVMLMLSDALPWKAFTIDNLL